MMASLCDMNKLLDLLPSEWRSAYENSKLLSEFVEDNGNPKVWGRVFIDSFLIIIVTLIVYQFLLDAVFIKSTLIVVGILTGFVINSLIFIGRDSNTTLLSYEEAEEYTGKVTFLLWTQISTLKVFLIYIFVALAYFIFQDENSPKLMSFLQMTLLWLLLFGLLRTILLPLQIYDLHAFNLNQLLEQKQKKEDKKRKELTQD